MGLRWLTYVENLDRCVHSITTGWDTSGPVVSFNVHKRTTAVNILVQDVPPDRLGTLPTLALHVYIVVSGHRAHQSSPIAAVPVCQVVAYKS